MSASSTIFSHVNHLADSIGPRTTGSTGNTQAVSYLEDQFNNLELKVEKQLFDVDIWSYEEVSCNLGRQSIKAVPFGFSSPGEIEGSILPLINPKPKRLESYKFSDKIIVYLNTMGFMSAMGGRGLSREDLIAKSEEKGAAAFIEVMNKPGGAIERRNLKTSSSIPSVAVSLEDGHFLLRNQKDVTLTVVGQKKTVSGENIIAKTEQNTEEKIILNAHYDTAPESPGAFDNATGVATLLELARVFSELKTLPFNPLFYVY